MSLSNRTIASNSMPAVGLGCMNLSQAYGNPTTATAGKTLLEKAFDLGVAHFDSVA